MRWIILLFLLTATSIAFSQSKRPNLAVETGFCKLNYHTVDSDEKLDDDIDSIIGSKSCEAFGHFTKARSVYFVQRTAVGVGAAMVAIPFLLYAFTQDEEMLMSTWPIAVGGVGLALVTIPLTSKLKKNAKESIEIYNYHVNLSGYHDEPRFRIGTTQSGFCVNVSF